MMLSITRFVNLILAALLAGTSFGIWIGFEPSGYSPGAYLEQQTNLVVRLNTLMVSLVILATLVTAFSAYLQRRERMTFVLLLLASASFASCLVISRFGNLPIQNEILTWTAETMPPDWTTWRDQWWWYHKLRAIAELIALTLVALVSSSAKPDHP